jgi:arylsulfatase A-like enzyme
MIGAAIAAYQFFTKEKQWNLIIVLVDTLRQDHLGYHGYQIPTSPQVDGLAAKSTVFANHYSPSSRTGPSVASIFTGLHPRSHGVINPLTHFDAKGVLSQDQLTLAEILKENGYRCYGFVANPNIVNRFGFGQGFDHYQFLQPNSASDLNRVAEEQLTKKKQPFFLYLHYMEPHSPYKAPAAYRRLFPSGSYHGPINGSHQQLDQILAGKLIPDSDDKKHLELLYDQEIRYFDEMLGELLQTVRDQNLNDNTIILFMSDHGEEFWDHGSVLHGYTLYEEQLRVPMFIYDPRRDAAMRIEAITRHIDLLPTILEILGVEVKTAAQGRSLVPWMNGIESSSAVGPVYAQVSLRAVKTVKLESFMKEGWKIIINYLPAKSLELYHLAHDPREADNLAAGDDNMRNRLLREIMEFRKSLPETKAGKVDLTDEEIKRLRSLGYIE